MEKSLIFISCCLKQGNDKLLRFASWKLPCDNGSAFFLNSDAPFTVRSHVLKLNLNKKASSIASQLETK